MNQVAYSPYDILLTTCTVTTASGDGLNFRDLVLELNYYEDIFSNCITGNLYISDSLNFINQLQLDGNERLHLKIETPTRDAPLVRTGENSQKDRSFRIYSVTNRKSISRTHESYILHFCSEELFLSEKMRVTRNFKNKKISEMVELILKEDLKLSDDLMWVENTINTRDIIIPAYKPFQAINWLTTQSLSEKYSQGTNEVGTTFLFYENKDGFIFESLHGLYNKKQVLREFFYDVQNIPETNFERQTNSVIAYEHIQNFNTIQQAHSGTFNNRLITFDPLRGLFKEKQFDYDKFTKQAPTINKNKFQAEDVDRTGTSLKNDTSVVRFSVSNTGQSENKYIKDKNISINENRIENVYPYRTSQLMLLTNNKMKIMVPGDTKLQIGELVTFNLPNRMAGTTGEELDEFYSGKYLITALRHWYQKENGFFSILEICKDSTEKPRQSQQNNYGF